MLDCNHRKRTLTYMEAITMIDHELQSLIDAAQILATARKSLCNEPMPVYLVASHACSYIEQQLNTTMRGDPLTA